MIYTSAIYDDEDTTLWQAQMNKLDHVAQSIGLKKGEKLLDIGCGWGRLIEVMSSKYGAIATGITLSQDQKEYAEKNVITSRNASIVLHDFMTWDVPDGSFDKITTLEMFEHVGIKHYTTGFEVQRVHNLGSHYSRTLNDWLTNWRRGK